MVNHSLVSKITKTHQEYYNQSGRIFRSPGRINLIGEHTDYNNGFVLPAAIKNSVYGIYSLNNDAKLNICSLDYNESIQITDLDSVPDVHWAKYFWGIYKIIQNRYCLNTGINCVFSSDIPIGSGLSSSAALETNFVYALNTLFNLEIDSIDIAKIGQLCEHEFIGVKCGIMDQMASVFGKEKHCLFIDCKDNSFRPIKIDLNNYEIVLVNSKVKHTLASSEYNDRRIDCETGVKLINNILFGTKSLRDVSPDFILKNKDLFTEVIYKRCLYITQENERVLKAIDFINKGKIMSFGKLLFESHYGLRDLYQVSCTELDFLVELAEANSGIIGSRMMGGGFGGCTINLIEKDKYAEFAKDVKFKYFEKFNIIPEIIEVDMANGAHEIEITNENI